MSKNNRLRRLEDLLAPEGARPVIHGWWCDPATCDYGGMGTFTLNVFEKPGELLPADREVEDDPSDA
jgi:hypothetical protein